MDNKNCVLSFYNLTEVSNIFMEKDENVALLFSVLTIGGNLEITGNANCSLLFNGLKKATTILMEGNKNTTLPGEVDSLEMADNVHLKGMMDT